MNPTLTSQESFTLSDSVYQMRMSDFCHNYMSTASSWTETKLERAVSPVMSNLEPICANESFINVSQINNNSPYINKICSFGLFPLNHHDSGMSSFSQTFNEIPNSSSPSYPTRTKPLINKNLLHVTGSSGRFQSTPNKSDTQQAKTDPSYNLVKKEKTNFHSISDLAKSSDSISLFDASENKDMSSGYFSNISTTVPVIRSKAEPTGKEIVLSVSNSISSFNEHFRKFAVQLENKENDGHVDHEFMYKTKRRPRAQISKQQREILEYAYKIKCYPDANEVEYLCNVLGFEENVIRVSL